MRHMHTRAPARRVRDAARLVAFVLCPCTFACGICYVNVEIYGLLPTVPGTCTLHDKYGRAGSGAFTLVPLSHEKYGRIGPPHSPS